MRLSVLLRRSAWMVEVELFVDGDLDVVLRVEAGQFRPDHIAVVPDRFLEPEHLARQERRQSCPRGFQPVGQVREQARNLADA